MSGESRPERMQKRLLPLGPPPREVVIPSTADDDAPFLGTASEMRRDGCVQHVIYNILYNKLKKFKYYLPSRDVEQDR